MFRKSYFQSEDPDAFSKLVPGYPRLAGFMTHVPEKAIFRRFGALNARNLLYLQNELTALEDSLKDIEARDSKDGRGTKAFYAKDWYWLQSSMNKDTDTLQLNLVLRIREMLKEYSMSNLPHP